MMSGWLEVTLIGMVFENREGEGLVSNDENGDRFNFYTTTVDMDKGIYQDILSIAADTSGEIADYPGAALIFVAQPISPSMTAASMKTGGNALGLPQNTNMMCPSPLPTPLTLILIQAQMSTSPQPGKIPPTISP